MYVYAMYSNIFYFDEQALQRVLVGLARHYDALLVAERARTRAFVDLLMDKQVR